MKKILLAFLLSGFIPSSFGFVPGLLEQGRKMIGLIEEARTCSVKLRGDSGQLTLCTGLTLEKEDIKFLKDLTLNSCQQFLVQMGYKVHQLTSVQDSQKLLDESILTESVVNDFFNSTKLAWILHKEKAILFKQEAKRGDCLHEVLHFYQRQRPRNNPLAPLSRKGEERRLQFLLEKAVAEVEKVEKKGDSKKAQEMAAKIQPFIALQREWQKLISWLDEKEIYQAFFDYPQIFSIGPRDRDIALANLVRLKDSLPWDLKERVLHEAQVALNSKYAQVKTPQSIGGHKSEEEYGKLYNQGKITRDFYEEKVIGLRKFEAWKMVKEARRKKDLLKTLIGRALARDFAKSEEKVPNPKGVELTYELYKELPSINVEGLPFIIDTGANDSVLPPEFLNGLQEKDVRLLGLKRLQTVNGLQDEAPVIQVLKGLNVGGVELKGLTFSVSELGLGEIKGILGMDFLQSINDGAWQWDFKKRQLGPIKKASFTKTYFLQSNGRGNIDALEFMCQANTKIKIRIDSGSQVIGDKPSGKELGQVGKCLANLKAKDLLDAPKLSALFSRGVDVNIGFNFLKMLKIMAFDLKKRELYLWEETP